MLTPDLSITDLEVSDPLKTGHELSGSFLVYNKGPVPATGVTTDMYLLDQNGSTPGLLWLGSRATEVVEPGILGKVPFSFFLSEGIVPGQYLVEATIRSDKPELFSDDNTITLQNPVTINSGEPWKGGYPNLVITIDDLASLVTAPGSPFFITYTVYNTNNQSAGSYLTGFYLSQDKEVSSLDYRFREEKSYSVSGNMEEQGISQDLIADTIPPGTYYLAAIVDDTGKISETDETDNIYYYHEPITVTSPIQINSPGYADLVGGLLFLKTNKYRSYLALPELKYDSFLSEIAYEHTSDMITRHYFSHYTPEGLDPGGRADLAGYDISRQMDDGSVRTGIAENIIRIASGHTLGKAYTGFVDPTSPESIANIMMIEWINSPEHNKNLINPDIKNIGIGVRFDGEFFFATQNFY